MPTATQAELLGLRGFVVLHPGENEGHEVVALAGLLIDIRLVDADGIVEFFVDGVYVTDGTRPSSFLPGEDVRKKWATPGIRPPPGGGELTMELLGLTIRFGPASFESPKS